MTFFFWMGTALALIYGLLTIVSGSLQIKVRKIPMWSAICFTLLGVVILTSTLFVLIQPKMIFILMVCFLLMHIIAVVNGLYLNEKINMTHHIVRFGISAFIIILFIV